MAAFAPCWEKLLGSVLCLLPRGDNLSSSPSPLSVDDLSSGSLTDRRKGQGPREQGRSKLKMASWLAGGREALSGDALCENTNVTKPTGNAAV